MYKGEKVPYLSMLFAVHTGENPSEQERPPVNRQNLMYEVKKMTPKEYLQQIPKINRLIDNKAHEIECLRELAEKITSVMQGDRVQSGSGAQSRMADCVDKIVDLQDELLRDVEKLIEQKRKIMKVADNLEGTYADIVYKRYFQEMRWEDIAESMGTSRQWVIKLHGNALKKVDKLLEVYTDNAI